MSPAERARVEATFGNGVEVCTRCHADLDSYADACTAALDDPCPGFLAIEAAARNEPKPAKLKRQPATAPGSDKTACPRCQKKVKRHGLPDHLRDKHGEKTNG